MFNRLILLTAWIFVALNLGGCGTSPDYDLLTPAEQAQMAAENRQMLLMMQSGINSISSQLPRGSAGAIPVTPTYSTGAGSPSTREPSKSVAKCRSPELMCDPRSPPNRGGCDPDRMRLPICR